MQASRISLVHILRHGRNADECQRLAQKLPSRNKNGIHRNANVLEVIEKGCSRSRACLVTVLRPVDNLGTMPFIPVTARTKRDGRTSEVVRGRRPIAKSGRFRAESTSR